jgi:hypothetical protein
MINLVKMVALRRIYHACAAASRDQIFVVRMRLELSVRPGHFARLFTVAPRALSS